MGIKKLMKMSKKKKVLLIAAAVVLIAVVGAAVHSGGSGTDDEEGMDAVTTTPAERMDITKKISSKGEIKPALDEKILPHAGYALEKTVVSEGQAVQEGCAILTYTNGQTMTAPYNCVVLEWDLPDPKQTISNSHYVKIASTDVMMIELTVNEDEVGLIKKGDPASIKVAATDRKYQGEVSFVSDVGDYEEGMSSFKVKVLFDNDGSLKLGMNGKAKIVLAKAENVIGVPLSAVTEDGGVSYVTVQKGDDPDDIEEKEVETGIDDGDFIEIKSGVKEGDMIQYVAYDEEEEEPYYY